MVVNVVLDPEKTDISNVPESWLLLISTDESFVKFLKELGMEPVNAFPYPGPCQPKDLSGGWQTKF